MMGDGRSNQVVVGGGGGGELMRKGLLYPFDLNELTLIVPALNNSITTSAEVQSIMLLTESQKGINAVQRCSIENQKGINAVQQFSFENQKGTFTIVLYSDSVLVLKAQR